VSQPASTEEPPNALSEQLDRLIAKAEYRSTKTGRWARFWQVVDITLGLATAVLAAIAGATGLASAAGRVPAAILALVAAGLGAASRFLESRERYERNRKRRNALQALERDALFAKASQGWPGAESLYDALRRLNDRWTVIINRSVCAPSACTTPGLLPAARVLNTRGFNPWRQTVCGMC
jgi:hypothetical protein